MFRIILLSTFLLFTISSFAQDVNCRVQVITPQIQSSDKRIFTDMQRAIFEFVNNRKWTDDIIQLNERIEINLIINVTQQTGIDEFKATAQIQSSRPVFGTSYNSTLFNFSDEEWTFKYLENQTLEFNDNESRSNLTSLLAYYMYLMIGLDYDSFSPMGGTVYFQKARNVVNQASTQPGKGWKAFDGTRNRFLLIDNLLDNNFKNIREVSYRYHRLGLDIMSQNIDNGRSEISACLPLIQKVYKDRPNSMLLNVFFNAKSEELINIYSKALPNEKPKTVQLLSEIDPTNTSKYQQILRAN